MCGVVAIVDHETTGAAHEPLARAMQARLAHRGPDGAGVHVASCAALAHTRLAVLDLDGGAQPIVSPDGRFALSYNGEIYNDGELRAALADRWSFRTRGDAEVVLAAWAAWGEGALHRLDGMFAFVVWDDATRTAIAARDRLGVKPLWFRRRGAALLVASEIKALFVDYTPRIDDDALAEWFLAPFASVRAPIRGVEAVPPGSLLRATPSGIAIDRWWSYDEIDDPPDEESLRAALVDSIRASLRGDVPVATFLSGGIDSTTIASVARGVAYTIRFADQDRYDYSRSAIVGSDDTPFAALAARELGLEHRIVPVDRDELLDAIPEIARADDTIPAWEQQLAQHFLARAAASDGFKVVLVGDAADETHHGYTFLLRRTRAEVLELFGAARRTALLRPERRASVALPDRFVVDRWLVRLLYNGDAHTMAHSLEARVPFAATRLLELARRVPVEIGFDKALVRRAARGLVPDAIRVRPKSALPKDQGVAPLYQRAAARILDEDEAFLGQYLRIDAVRELCQRPIDEVDRAILFQILSLCHWRRARGIA